MPPEPSERDTFSHSAVCLARDARDGCWCARTLPIEHKTRCGKIRRPAGLSASGVPGVCLLDQPVGNERDTASAFAPNSSAARAHTRTPPASRACVSTPASAPTADAYAGRGCRPEPQSRCAAATAMPGHSRAPRCRPPRRSRAPCAGRRGSKRTPWANRRRSHRCGGRLRR